MVDRVARYRFDKQVEPELLPPPSPGSFVCFSLTCSRGGSSTAAAVTLDTVADESRKMSDGVARFPSRLCSGDSKICCYGDALSTIFLLACFCALLPTFRFSFFFPFFSLFFPLDPGMCILFVSLRLCSSHLLLSASTYFIVRVLSACVICTLPHLGIILFFCSSSIFLFVALIPRVAFFVVLSYPVR